VWLALTGARLKAADMLLLGIATDYMESARVADFKAALIADPGAVETLLTEYEGDAGRPPLAERFDDINRLFDHARAEDIVAALEADGGEWAKAQLATLATKSPQTIKVALRQLRTGATLSDFADNMAMEYRIGSRVVRMADFLEGVRAVIVDKDNAPRWDPPTLEGVNTQRLDDIFAHLPADEEWTPLAPAARKEIQ
jgi:enoyl-CoA hydratase